MSTRLKTPSILEADLPGVKAEDVKVEAENGELVLQGCRSIETSHGNGQFHTMERSSGNFVRRIKLPASIDKTAIEVKFHDGVLQSAAAQIKGEKRGEAR